MEFIDMERLRARRDEIRDAFRSQQPFHWTMFDGFFRPAKAEEVYDSYPATADEAEGQAHEEGTDVTRDLHQSVSQQLPRSLMILRKPGCSR